jgi:hypothetical protein
LRDKKSKRRKEKELARLEDGRHRADVKTVKIQYDQVWDVDHTPSDRFVEENFADAQSAATLPKMKPKYRRKRHSVLLYGKGDLDKRASKYSNQRAGRLLLFWRKFATKHLRKDLKESQVKELKEVRADRKEAKFKKEIAQDTFEKERQAAHKEYMFGGAPSVRKAKRPTHIKESNAPKEDEVSKEDAVGPVLQPLGEEDVVQEGPVLQPLVSPSHVSCSWADEDEAEKNSGSGEESPRLQPLKRPPPPPPKPAHLQWKTPVTPLAGGKHDLGPVKTRGTETKKKRNTKSRTKRAGGPTNPAT